MTNKTRTSIVAMLAVTLAVSAVAASIPSATADVLTDKVVNYHSSQYDKHTDKWVSWWASLDDPNKNDITSDTYDCTDNQSGKVWYLQGTDAEVVEGEANDPGGIIEVDCTIPKSTKLLFPLVNVFPNADTAENTEQQYNELATVIAFGGYYEPWDFTSEGATDLTLVVDGVDLSANLDQYQIQEFNAFEAECVNWGYPFCDDGDYWVHAGHYILLNPLSPGEHTIEFGGAYPSLGFQTGATYHITVE